jgi:urea carboxylase
MWNTDTASPWLLRFFDQIRFHPVSADELTEIRDAFPHGKYPLRIESQEFGLKEYHSFLASIASGTHEFRRRQHQAFMEERDRWGLAANVEVLEAAATPQASEEFLPEGCTRVRSPIAANVWTVSVEPGQQVEAGQKLVVLEAMKMEIAVAAPAAGVVETLNCAAGVLVYPGQNLVTMRVQA